MIEKHSRKNDLEVDMVKKKRLNDRVFASMRGTMSMSSNKRYQIFVKV